MKALILNFGGTIGMVRGEKGLRPPADDSEFRRAVESVTSLYPALAFDFETLCAKDSTDLTPADWEALSARLWTAQDVCDFIIVPHGTDTAAQTAMAATFGFLAKNSQGEVLNAQRIPVVFTGAQHPLFRQDSDGFANLKGAIETGIAGAQAGVADVLIVFHGRIMRGVDCRKVSDVDTDVYHSISGQYAGHVDSGGARLTGDIRRIGPEERARLEALDKAALSPLNRFRLPEGCYIETLLLQPGASGGALAHIARDPACLGAVLVVLGAGNVPDTLTGAVKEAARQYGFPMFAVSPFPGGNANPGAYEAGSRAFEAGVTFLADKAPALAYVTAHWLIAGELARTAAEFSRNMQRAWVNETRHEAIHIPPALLEAARDASSSYEARLENARKTGV